MTLEEKEALVHFMWFWFGCGIACVIAVLYDARSRSNFYDDAVKNWGKKK